MSTEALPALPEVGEIVHYWPNQDAIDEKSPRRARVESQYPGPDQPIHGITVFADGPSGGAEPVRDVACADGPFLGHISRRAI